MKKTISIILVLGIAVVVLVAFVGMYKFNYLASLPGYDVDGNKIEEGNNFEIIEVLDQSCQITADCETPVDYAVQSSCPYDSVCLKNRCTVICPHPFAGTQVGAPSPKDATYTIDGNIVTLVDGVVETEAAPGSASKITTRYFGNEVRSDLNNDGREDVVFLLTQETGGSGIFFYVVAALNTEDGWIGSKGYLLGDRIAPQTTQMSNNPNHQNVIVVNYADRAPGEPMSIEPSVGVSVWLKLNTNTMLFGEVVQDFEGEADPNMMTLDMHQWTWVRTQYNDDTELVPNQTDAFTVTFSGDGTVSATTDCNSMKGTYKLDGNQITFSPMAMTRMFCSDSQEHEFAKMFEEIQSYFFTAKGELVFEFKFDSGVAIFR